MSIKFVECNPDYYQMCIKELWNSELGKAYFKDLEDTKNIFEKIVKKEKLLIALDKDEFIGFVCYSENGMFNGFPYIHFFVIAENIRSKGYGTKMLDIYEDIIRKDFSRVFLLVGDFNSKAKTFYEKKDYLHVGDIPKLYRETIIEQLMMKVLK
jgi:ribosomal protein S18 acetylase RimI-like enzyme